MEPLAGSSLGSSLLEPEGTGQALYDKAASSAM